MNALPPTQGLLLQMCAESMAAGGLVGGETDDQTTEIRSRLAQIVMRRCGGWLRMLMLFLRVI